MSQFTPRNGKANDMKPRGKSYYYHCPIPEQFRSFLVAKTDAGRRAEAGALAHQHNEMMTIGDFESVATAAQNKVDDTVSLKLDFSPENLPVNKQMPPFEFYRDGKIERPYKIAGSNDPHFLKQAEDEGYFAMTGSEFVKQIKLMKLRQSSKSAEGSDEKELAGYRLSRARRERDKLAPSKGDTLRTILSKMHQQYQPRQSTMTDSITALRMLVWTDARPEEICQLRLEGVDLDRMGFVITNESDDLEAPDRKLENEEPVRGVPILRVLFPRLHDHIDHVRQVNKMDCIGD